MRPESRGRLKYWFEALDGVRGASILMVLLYHSTCAAFGYYHLPWNGIFRSFDAPWSFLLLSPCTLGYLEVSVFFVVSGFCIHLSFEKGCERDLKVFAAKRFFGSTRLIFLLCFYSLRSGSVLAFFLRRHLRTACSFLPICF
jgi:peptidoglycan/LPS O-acetylase OafA/YrhL